MIIKLSKNTLSRFSSFLKGASIVMDLTGSLSHKHIEKITTKKDEDVLFEDWSVVGADLSNSIEKGKQLYAK